MKQKEACAICGCNPKDEHSLGMAGLHDALVKAKTTITTVAGAEIKRMRDGRTARERAKNIRREQRRAARDSIRRKT